MLIGRAVTHPSEVFDHLRAATSVLALQSGEQGPFAQAIAGVDIVLWDLFARRAKTPLWRMLGGSSGRMRAYASGINPDGCVAVEAAMRRGHRAFKLKIGFGAERDRGNLRELRWLIGDHVLAVDVNQGWSLAEAREQAPSLEQFGLAWLEEPLRADRPWSEWRSLPEQVSVLLAGGENIAGSEAFATVLAEGVLSVIQPDVAKWGGVTGCIAVAREVVAAKRTDCPHYLGGGIGLVASAHLLAACNGGWLESTATPTRCATISAARLPLSATARSCCRSCRGLASRPTSRQSRCTGRYDHWRLTPIPRARLACSHRARRSTGSRP
jgi:D-galactarolactone cycloisomerase